MKKKVFIFSTVFLLFVAALVVASGVYINANIEDITRQHLGAGIQFENVAFNFTPLPAISFSQLRIKKGKNRINIPSIVLYPDLLALVKGNVVMKRAVVDEPLIIFEKTSERLPKRGEVTPGSGEKPAAPLTTTAIPVDMINEIMVRGGKLVLDSKSGKIPAVSFAVAVEKIEKIIPSRCRSKTSPSMK